MAGDPLNGGGFVILNGIRFDDDGKIVDQPMPYPGSNLFSLASGGAIYLRDPFQNRPWNDRNPQGMVKADSVFRHAGNPHANDHSGQQLGTESDSLPAPLLFQPIDLILQTLGTGRGKRCRGPSRESIQAILTVLPIASQFHKPVEG